MEVKATPITWESWIQPSQTKKQCLNYQKEKVWKTPQLLFNTHLHYVFIVNEINCTVPQIFGMVLQFKALHQYNIVCSAVQCEPTQMGIIRYQIFNEKIR